MLAKSSSAHYLMLLSIVLAASSFPIGAAITHELPPVVMMFIRFSLAALLFAPYVFFKNQFILPSTKKLFQYGALGIPLAVFFWCMFESLRYTSVLNTGALYTLVPAITAVIAGVINREVSSRQRVIGLMLGTIGALWIVFRGDFYALARIDLNYGDLTFLVGCVFLATYNPLVKKVHTGEPMEVMTFWVMFFAAVWLLIASYGSFSQVDWQSVGLHVYCGILYLAVFSTLITFFLLQLSVVRIGATKVASYGFLTPLFVMAFSVILGIDEFEYALIPGMLLVVLAMAVIQGETAKPEPAVVG